MTTSRERNLVKKRQMYSVALRRDVQQVASVVVEASSRQEAVDLAESWLSDDSALWKVEEQIGTHKPQVKLKPKAIK